MKNKIIMLAVLLLISMSTASAFVFEKPRDDVFFEKKRGKFASDVSWNNDNGAPDWEKVMKMINSI